MVISDYMQENISLQEYNTFDLKAKAAYFQCFKNIEELNEELTNVIELGKSLLVLGGGSNMLLIKDWESVVLKNEIKGIELTDEYSQF